MEGFGNANDRTSWDENTIVEQIWADLQGAVPRSAISQELKQVGSKFESARIKTYIPIFLRRETVERLRARLVLATGNEELNQGPAVRATAAQEGATAFSR
jgi:hypothetical protein